MARARQAAREEIGRLISERIILDGYNNASYVEFENRHGNRWQVALDQRPHVRFTPIHNEAIFTALYQQTPLPEQEIASNDRHSPNRQRRPQGVPQGRNVSRFGHSRRHRG